jgi:hypothetical protein
MLTEDFAGWIDAEIEQPDELTTVLVYTALDNVTLGAVYEGAWQVHFAPWELSREDRNHIEVVCWRYLPRPGFDF